MSTTQSCLSLLTNTMLSKGHIAMRFLGVLLVAALCSAGRTEQEDLLVNNTDRNNNNNNDATLRTAESGRSEYSTRTSTRNTHSEDDYQGNRRVFGFGTGNWNYGWRPSYGYGYRPPGYYGGGGGGYPGSGYGGYSGYSGSGYGGYGGYSGYPGYGGYGNSYGGYGGYGGGGYGGYGNNYGGYGGYSGYPGYGNNVAEVGYGIPGYYGLRSSAGHHDFRGKTSNTDVEVVES